MSDEDKISLAETLFSNQNFQRAGKLFKDLANSEDNGVLKIELLEKAKYSKTFKKDFLNSSPGEAIFPTIRNDNKGYVYTLKIEKKLRDSFDNRIQKEFEIIKDNVEEFINNQFKVHNKKITVFDFGIKNITIKIKNVLNSSSISLENNIWGNSYSLSAAVALVSYLINESISTDYAFSGSLEFRDDEIYIKKVEDLSEKEKILREEYSNLKKFYSSRNVKTFSELLIEIFGENYLDEILKMAAFKSKAEFIKMNIKENGEVVIRGVKTKTIIFEFVHSNNVPANKLTELYKFFSTLDFSKYSEPIIIDGLKPNFATGMLSQMFVNKVNKFVALKYTQSPVPEKFKKNFANVGVIIYKGKGYHEVKIGELVYY